MPGPTHEQTLNVALGEVLGGLRRSWRTRAEQTGNVLQGGGRPDILVEDASNWPVVIEAERANHASAEQDAIARLGKVVASTGRRIETAIALVYPDELTYLDGEPLREAINRAGVFEYALYTRRIGEPPERLPEQGWVRGGIRDLAMLVHRAATPGPRVEALATEFENGIERASDAFTGQHAYGSELGAEIAAVLGQEEDKEGQTRRMAMTVIANALIFHESLAEAGFQVVDTPGGPKRSVRSVASFRTAGAFAPDDLCDEWTRILKINYWPIFWTAKEMLGKMPVATANAVLNWLWTTARALVAGGVTQSRDLTGIVFQKLIADRKFLATYYTRPEAAALLAALALPADRAPGGADWGDGDTLARLQVGDFACGTGTLLSAAYQRLSLLHEMHGGDPRVLHGPMMKHGLVGLDVVNIAVHLTAAMLAGSHPDTPFDGECLLTMPYGRQDDQTIAVGSLDLLADSVQSSFIDTAAAVTSGGREPEEVRDLVSRVGHGKFDLVIMNPPFTRPTNHEAGHANVPIPAYAAFESSHEEQEAMSAKVKMLTQGAPSNDYAGLASHFVELSRRKVRRGGTMAFVLPLSAMSGGSWDGVRQMWREAYTDIIVVTIAGESERESSFSAETDIGECLVIARRGEESVQRRGTFVVLRNQVKSTIEAELLANEIHRIRASGELAELEGNTGLTRIGIQNASGASDLGVACSARIPQTGPWPLVGIRDGDIAQSALHLTQGRLIDQRTGTVTALTIVPIARVAKVGPVHRLIGSPTDTARGAFRVVELRGDSVPTYPVLWAHDTRRERFLEVAPDSEGKSWEGTNSAVRIWSSATRAHYNCELRFNSQSLIVGMTEHPCIGGRAWPTVIFENRDHEYAFALWCNSTLGLLLHWWSSNKTQSGRGTTTVTGIPNIPTLDTRVLTAEQHAAAEAAFEAMRERRFLPFDQVDEDPARAELDRRLLVDVLGLPESLCVENGPIDLLRRKLAREPQIHGGKKSRVVFTEAKDPQGNVVLGERSEHRNDR